MIEKQETSDLIAKNIKSIMGNKKITSNELSRKCNISPGMVSKIINRNTGISIVMAMSIASGLDVDLMDILAGLTSPEKKAKEKLNNNNALSIGILSIEKKRITCVKDAKNETIGQSQINTGIDLAEPTSILHQLVDEAIIAASPHLEKKTSVFKQSNLVIVAQSYEFETIRHKFTTFMQRHFKHVLILSDWHFMYLANFHHKAPGISLIVDKGISLSFFYKGGIKKIGGWKFPVYDFGGENWLGLETIRHTIQAHDGYIPASKLSSRVLSHFNGKLSNAVEVCFNGARSPDIFASFVDILLRCYYEKDPSAISIVNQGYLEIEKTIKLADQLLEKTLPITINGSLAKIYKPYIKAERTAAEVNLISKVDMLASLKESDLLTVVA
ncbi:Glucosamine kinase GspK [Piscirickettsia salmonis]|uniref:helix-turn-helix domain-containing protein n=1 Tax=Piscirickettsia salmonis TaxID=1238 RepID=UPI001E607507|nr:helix-turn-helix domain-containing protein [Piscirickettsia salmonis]QGP56363.1 Glucosamine kinase GspK [Piscirickettsia salmonis]QGP57774.1 Glucosamine kinase GspK [Piscirickettsia salmonis]QGP65926.1 Glucosamine kinase GspK [Piscirickettsia salmonis]